MLKVIHICTTLDGGAGLCAQRIIWASRRMGVDARAIVISGLKNDTTDIINFKYPWSSIKAIKKCQAALSLLGLWPKDIRQKRRIEKIINKENVKYNQKVTFTSPYSIYKNICDHPWVKEADIVHLHWIGNFIDYPTFFSNIDKPIVWTLHDENPGLGGFHFSSWKEKAPKSFQELDDKWMLIKDQAYKSINTSMTIVAISKMMSTYINSNPLLKTFPNVLIHNGVDTNAFKIISKKTAREALSIPQNNIVFMFSAYYIHDKRKGLKELISALSSIDVPNITLICLGNYYELPQAPFDLRCEGFVGNNQLQSIYYSASDYFVLPSFQEAFAQTPLEAMSCGTPVIAFPCSGAEDLINDNNGVVCDQFTEESLNNNILLAMDKKFDRNEIRNYIYSHFSYEIITKEYIKLYKSILKR